MVTMATYIFQRLIREKIKVDIFFSVIMGIFGIYFYRNVY